MFKGRNEQRREENKVHRPQANILSNNDYGVTLITMPFRVNGKYAHSETIIGNEKIYTDNR